MSAHWYVTWYDNDFTDPPRAYNLDRADALFIYTHRELCARFTTNAPNDEYVPTIYEGDDAENELGRVLLWLEGGPDPCKRRRDILTGEAE